jgi:ankyrin repeat protein
MQLLDLANEILWCIAESVQSDCDLNSFLRTSRRLYDLLCGYLYERNVKQHGSSAFFWAAYYDRLATAEKLLERGAHVDVHLPPGDNPFGVIYRWTPLMLAASQGNEAIVRLFLEQGADVNYRSENGHMPLMVGARSGNEAVVRVLVESGADVTAKSEGGSTALLFAAEKGYEAVVRLLVERGADVNAQTWDYEDGSAPLLEAAKGGYWEIVKFLVEKGADVKFCDRRGLTALWFADDQEMTNFLIEHGADVNKRGKHGHTPLMLAAAEGNIGLAKLLLENGADVNLMSNSWDQTTALHSAAEKGQQTMARFLMARGARLDPEHYQTKDVIKWLESDTGKCY